MGFKETLSQIFTRDPKEKPLKQSMEKWGLKVVADRKLEDRLKALQEFFNELEKEINIDPGKDPIKYVDALQTKQQMLNRAIHSLATPYYRSGSNAPFREIMEGWQLWNSMAMYWLEATRDRIQSIQEENIGDDGAKTALLRIATIDIETLVRRLQTVLQFHVWQDGQLVLAESYLNPDVSSSDVTIITSGGELGWGVDLASLEGTKPEEIE